MLPTARLPSRYTSTPGVSGEKCATRTLADPRVCADADTVGNPNGMKADNAAIPTAAVKRRGIDVLFISSPAAAADSLARPPRHHAAESPVGRPRDPEGALRCWEGRAVTPRRARGDGAGCGAGSA